MVADGQKVVMAVTTEVVQLSGSFQLPQAEALEVVVAETFLEEVVVVVVYHGSQLSVPLGFLLVVEVDLEEEVVEEAPHGSQLEGSTHLAVVVVVADFEVVDVVADHPFHPSAAARPATVARVATENFILTVVELA